MAGLLDFLPEDETKRAAALQGLLAAGLGMMKGAYNEGGRFAPAVGQGGLMGMQAYGSSIQNAQQQQLRDFQMQQAKAQMQQAEAQRTAAQKFAQGLPENQREAAMAFPELAAKQMFTRPDMTKEEQMRLQYQLQRENQEAMARLTAGLRPAPQPVAPTMTEVLDPKDPTRLLRVDAKTYAGGTLGSPGVLGVSGKEPSFAAKEGKLESGKQQLGSTLDSLQSAYDNLQTERAIPSKERGALSNITSYMAGTEIGQVGGRMVGTQAQQNRDIIASSRMLLLNDIKNATGMSAQQMNSNVELQNWLRALGDPNIGYETATQIIQNIRDKYIAPGGAAAPAGKPGSPVKDIPGGAYEETKTLNGKQYGKRGGQWYPL
jgi:hypothetical protein